MQHRRKARFAWHVSRANMLHNPLEVKVLITQLAKTGQKAKGRLQASMERGADLEASS